MPGFFHPHSVTFLGRTLKVCYIWGMDTQKFIAYYRVSTAQQGKSGLGLEAQQDCIACQIDGDLIHEYTEVESGSRGDRPELAKALDHCKRVGATLVIAKLDRLSRSVSFIFQLRDAGVRFLACDCPDFNTLTLGVFASFAQYERERIADRTKAALQKKRDRDGEWRVSNLSLADRAKGCDAMRAKAARNENNVRAKAFLSGLGTMSLQAKADLLNENGFRTARGGQFSRVQVSRLMA